MRVRVAVGYARSSGSVNPASSIPNQILSIKEYCEKRNIHLKEIYVDERKTGTKVNGRNQYKLLMKQLKYQSEIELVLVAFLDRLGRESFELIQAVEEIRLLKKELVCIKEGVTSKSLTPLQLAMMAVQAETENKQRTRRLADSKNSKIQKGKYLLSGVPYGYILDNDKKLVKDPIKSLIVEKIFHLYRQGDSISNIARKINYEYGSTIFDYTKISLILKNKTYTGYIHIRTDSEESGYRKLSEVAHESIISNEIFDECYALYLERKPKGKPTHFYLLSNSVFLCPVCQSDVGVNSGNYICKSKCWKANIITVDDLVIEFLLEKEKETKEEGELRTAYET